MKLFVIIFISFFVVNGLFAEEISLKCQTDNGKPKIIKFNPESNSNATITKDGKIIFGAKISEDFIRYQEELLGTIWNNERGEVNSNADVFWEHEIDRRTGVYTLTIKAYKLKNWKTGEKVLFDTYMRNGNCSVFKGREF